MKINTRNSEYWQKRALELEDIKFNQSENLIKEIQVIYDKTIVQMDKDINYWYSRFAKNNGISMFEARKLLNSEELKEFKWTVEDYIKRAKESSINQNWIKELENVSARVHVSRLEAIKLQTRHLVESLYGEELKSLDNGFASLYKDMYYKQAFNIFKGFEVGYSFNMIDENRIKTVLEKPWAADGRNFSDRVWTDKGKLINTIHTELSQAIITGKSPNAITKKISEVLGVNKRLVSRLVHTESTYIYSESQKDCFKELGVERFEFVATLDSRTSDKCRLMDNRNFPMSEYEIGTNVPPLHTFCRSVICPYFEDEEISRIVGGGGNSYYIDSKINYQEWYDNYVKEKN